MREPTVAVPRRDSVAGSSCDAHEVRANVRTMKRSYVVLLVMAIGCAHSAPRTTPTFDETALSVQAAGIRAIQQLLPSGVKCVALVDKSMSDPPTQMLSTLGEPPARSQSECGFSNGRFSYRGGTAVLIKVRAPLLASDGTSARIKIGYSGGEGDEHTLAVELLRVNGLWETRNIQLVAVE